jgi:hypothetical protein
MASNLSRPDLDIRPRMIALALAFVREARVLPGVTSIGLVGSLATRKVDPKDIDMLVSVTDDVDLASLAAAARRLHGRAMGIGKGTDVFLMDGAGNYLGRSCLWRDCRPGIRKSCDALHCGRRTYLHDDLRAVSLDGSLMAAPPLVLWPQIVARAPIPPDVERGLVSPLRAKRKAGDE